MIVKIEDCKPRKHALLGATLGEQHMASTQKAIDQRTLPEGELIILDFSGVAAVNGSYIKTTAFWLFLCARLNAKKSFSESPIRHPSDPRPYNLFIAVAGLGREVEEEFIDFFRARRIPLIVAKEWNDDSASAATLEGHLDPALKTTLTELVKSGGGNAPQLHQDLPTEGITVTAWNNRLSDLNALRLVRRTRNGKLWEYKPIAERITYGRSIS